MTDAKICHLLDLWSTLYLVYKYENASFRKRLIGYSCDELYKLCVSVVYILNICRDLFLVSSKGQSSIDQKTSGFMKTTKNIFVFC